MKFLPDPPEKVTAWVREHPGVLVGATVILIGFNLMNLVEAIDLYHRARELLGEVQREASEALGG